MGALNGLQQKHADSKTSGLSLRFADGYFRYATF